jgi:hypothetical protein
MHHPVVLPADGLPELGWLVGQLARQVDSWLFFFARKPTEPSRPPDRSRPRKNPPPHPELGGRNGEPAAEQQRRPGVEIPHVGVGERGLADHQPELVQRQAGPDLDGERAGHDLEPQWAR